MIRTVALRRRECGEIGEWPAHVPPLLRRIYAARGATRIELAQPRLAHLLPPDGLLDLDAAVALLGDAIERDAHIVVVGDFDCDGATACAVGVRGLRMLGARRVSHAVPNRMVHGYGLSPPLVDELAALEPDLLVTVDHGIACHAGIAAAKARGWRVLVTDHHLPGPTLPPADAIVNPNRPGDAFPSKAMAGVGVMFYVLLALRRHLRERGRLPEPAPDLAALLDLVAVGTIADLVPLDTNNRALVSAGLRRLRAGQGCAGLRALIEVSRRDAVVLTAADIGYAIAPRLNAAGRLEDMSLGIACLLAEDMAQARDIAQTLDEINAERRAVQQQMTEEAEAAVARIALDGTLPPVLCLYDPEWHPGVVGLVASKLKERLHRPVIAFAPAEPAASSLRGSARSIPGFHIRDALATVAAARAELLERFGGHAMAAGLSLRSDALAAFRAAFEECAARLLTPELLQAELHSDGELALDEFTRGHAECLRDGGPWGMGFPEPQFDGVFEVLGWRVVGGRHLRMELACGGRRLDAIEFGGWSGTAPPARVRLVFRLEPDDWRGGDAVQLVVVHREPA
ncbi:single-stranded-DNA-specific exonuclease RecJ [Vulcaniibacterium thermophilum]|uniref:Single-stranded-DNA-specific exonuclease RecJ n=1 Tax=Vulcaniibacterium thermophilum TaxID=1169913 RepID=A0A918Z295_9GAMM|nr:single-stranded-DNA-specific exonuclease RecJ [Vulcaniibacterium thermophilum]GHE34078.1 single-stranded-DNA-specific exonuclease RecJ [Vulcaniibacterium thermophilum]